MDNPKEGETLLETTPEQAPAQTEMPEQKLEVLKTRLEKAEALAAEREKGIKTVEKKLAEKDLTITQLKESQEEVQSIRDEMKVLAAWVASATGKTEEDFEKASKTDKDSLLKQFETMETQRKAKKAQLEFQQKADGFRKQVEDMGYTESDEEYWDIHDLVVAGNFQRAEVKIKKLEDKKVKETREIKTETPKETPEQIEERIRRKILEEYGLNTREKVGPSGTGSKRIYSRKEIGEMSLSDYEKIKPDVDLARKEGRIKD